MMIQALLAQSLLIFLAIEKLLISMMFLAVSIFNVLIRALGGVLHNANRAFLIPCCLINMTQNTEKGKKNKGEQLSSGNQGYAGPKKDRVTDTDRAILDVKGRMKQIKIYKDKLDIQIQQQDEKIKDLLRSKQKQRAVIALKHKKFIEKELDKAYGAQQMLQQTIQNIESAQMDVNVMDALKKGDSVIQELHNQAKMEDFEELYERHQDQMAMKEREQELFGQVLNEEELEDELAKLDAEIADMQIPNAASGIVESNQVNVPQKEPAKQKKQEEEKQMIPA